VGVGTAPHGGGGPFGPGGQPPLPPFGGWFMGRTRAATSWDSDRRRRPSESGIRTVLEVASFVDGEGRRLARTGGARSISGRGRARRPGRWRTRRRCHARFAGRDRSGSCRADPALPGSVALGPSVPRLRAYAFDGSVRTRGMETGRRVSSRWPVRVRCLGRRGSRFRLPRCAPRAKALATRCVIVRARSPNKSPPRTSRTTKKPRPPRRIPR
jgi:hypothetical protein